MLKLRSLVLGVFGFIAGWVALMSGILSVAREFYGLYSGSVPARDVFRFSALLAFVVSGAIAWYRQRLKYEEERKRVLAKEAEIERIIQTANCPIVVIIWWGENGGSRGFGLSNQGETAAIEVTVQTFLIGQSISAHSKMIPSVPERRTGTGYAQIWLEGIPPDADKWDLIAAFKSSGNPAPLVSVVYRDHRNFWYRTTQTITYVPENNDFEFGPENHYKLGLNRP